MKTETRAIKALLLERGEALTIRELAKRTGANYSIVHTAVRRLMKKGVLESRKVGSSVTVRLAPGLPPDVFQAEIERKTELLKKPGIKAVNEKLSKLSFPFMALVFGSYARGEEKKISDIDIMVISSKDREREVADAISILPLDIHLVQFSYEEFLSMARSREFTVVSEAIKSNVILTGVEDFYRLVSHA